MPSAPPRPPLSQVLALLGASLTTAMANLAQTTVLGLLVYDLTRSELDLGLLGLAEFAPALLLMLVAGAAADRFDRRRVTAFGAIANAVVALALAWYVHSPRGLSVTPIFVLVLAFGSGQAFLSPALRSLPAAMVSNEGVPWLVARRSVASQTATIIGPVLGGLLYGAGAWVPLVAAAVLSGAGAALVMAIRVPDRGAGQLSAGAGSTRSVTTRSTTCSRMGYPPRGVAFMRLWRVCDLSALSPSSSALFRLTCLPCSSEER